MVTTVLKEKIIEQIDALSPDGLAEVAQFIEFVQFKNHPPLSKATVEKGAAFGMWADYPEVEDSADFALKIRQKLESRQDGNAFLIG